MNPIEEKQLLGAILTVTSNLKIANERIKPADFLFAANNLIFEAMIHCYMTYGSLDLAILCKVLGDYNYLDNVGGLAYLQSLMVDCANPYNIEAYLTFIESESVRRGVLNSAKAIEQLASDRSIALPEVISKSQDYFYHAINRQATHGGDNFKDQLMSWYDNPQTIRGFRSGWNEIDTLSGGWGDRALIVVLGLSGGGKSLFLQDICLNLCGQGNLLVVPTEMTKSEWQNRMVAMLLGTNMEVLRFGGYRDKRKLQEAAEKVENLPIVFSEHAKPSALQVLSEARLHNPDIIIVDGLSDLGGDSDNEFIKTTANIEGLHTIYRELHKVVITSVQTNTDSKNRADEKKGPIPSDARGSGSRIFQLATHYYSLYRPAQYVEQNVILDAKGKFDPNTTIFTVLKDRWTGSAGKNFKRNFARGEDGRHAFLPARSN